MVPIKREPLTAFVSDTVAVLEHARGVGAARWWKGALVVVIGHQVLYPRFRGWWLAPGWGKSNRAGVEGWRGGGGGEGGETVKRYWIHRVFHEDSMKIARDFITGEMSVNKNEWEGRERCGGNGTSFYGRARAPGAYRFRLVLSPGISMVSVPIRKCDLAPTALNLVV